MDNFFQYLVTLSKPFWTIPYGWCLSSEGWTKVRWWTASCTTWTNYCKICSILVTHMVHTPSLISHKTCATLNPCYFISYFNAQLKPSVYMTWGYVVILLLETSVCLLKDSVVWNTHKLIQRFCSCYTAVHNKLPQQGVRAPWLH